MDIRKKCNVHLPDEVCKLPVDDAHYDMLIEPYLLACEKTELLLDELERMHVNDTGEELFINKSSRIKTVNSIRGKLIKKDIPLTFESVLDEVTDVAGVRLVCKTIPDVLRMVRYVRTMPYSFVLREKNYVDTPKSNGYRSYHITIGMRVTTKWNSSIHVPVEIQVRTEAMHWWASIEHELFYKPTQEHSDMEREQMFRYAQKIQEIELREHTQGNTDLT